MTTIRTLALLPVFTLVLMPATMAHGDSVMDQEEPIVQLADKHPVLFKRAVDNYVQCLKSDNSGVVESALAHVVQLRLVFPNESFEQINTEVIRLASSGSTSSIRFKAALARQIFENSAPMDLKSLPSAADPDALFAELGMRLSRALSRVDR